MDWEKEDLHNVTDPLLLDDTVDRQQFAAVFLKGRRKLRKLKFKLIVNFLLKNPIAATRMVWREPGYYLPMLSKWLFRQ